MQFQADILGIPVVRPKVVETTALGAAYAAGLATGVWASRDDLRAHWQEDVRFEPRMPVDEREQRYGQWKKAVIEVARLGRRRRAHADGHHRRADRR